MRRLFRNFQGIAAKAALVVQVVAPVAALVAALLTTGALQLANAQAAPEKKVKDQGEYDIYNQVLKDTDPAKQIQDLDTWTQKYPESDYKNDDRPYLYLQAYNKAKQPAKVLEIGDQLLSKGLKTLYKNDQQILTILFTVSVNLQALPAPTAAQFDTGQKAAQELQTFIPTFFTPANKPPAASEADWTTARGTMEKVAKDTLMFIATKAGSDAMTKYTTSKDPKECVTAEAAYRKALEQFVDSPAIAYQLGRALRCQQAASPDKVPQAIYEFARAAAIDPTLGGTMDAKALQTYLENAYSGYHGSLDGLDQLKQQAKSAPLPPAGFTIETASAIAAAKQAKFEQSNPQLAIWMKVKGALADTNGEAYFASSLKDTAVPKLKGTLVEGKPACRSTTLLVAIPDPDQPGATLRPEITLKLDAALSGKPEAGAEIQWEGVPTAFTKDPAFMLTMDTEKAKIEGLKPTPCAGAAPAQKKAGGAPKKKQ
jgi:hypothetical protein